MDANVALEKPTFVIRALQGNVAQPAQAVLEKVLNVYCQCEDFLALGPAPASMEMVLADLAHSLDEGGRFCGIYAPESGVMMGIVDFIARGYHGDDAAAFLALLMIGAPHRGHGLGEAVVQAVEQEVQAGGVRKMLSGVQVNNPRAIHFWQRMGYRVTSGPVNHPDGTTAFDLEKILAE